METGDLEPIPSTRCWRSKCKRWKRYTVLATMAAVLTGAIGVTISYREDVNGALAMAHSDEEHDRINAGTALFRVASKAQAGLREIARHDDTSGANARAALAKLEKQAATK